MFGMVFEISLVDKINRIINDNGIKQTVLARKIGISKSHFCDILKKRARMTEEIENKLRDALAIYLALEQAPAN
jgi:antitoxin component HigA of HigAB toxin-antitoxin module